MFMLVSEVQLRELIAKGYYHHYSLLSGNYCDDTKHSHGDICIPWLRLGHKYTKSNHGGLRPRIGVSVTSMMLWVFIGIDYI